MVTANTVNKKVGELKAQVDATSTLLGDGALGAITKSVDKLVADHKKNIEKEWQEGAWDSLVHFINNQPDKVKGHIMLKLQDMLGHAFKMGYDKGSYSYSGYRGGGQPPSSSPLNINTLIVLTGEEVDLPHSSAII